MVKTNNERQQARRERIKEYDEKMLGEGFSKLPTPLWIKTDTLNKMYILAAINYDRDNLGKVMDIAINSYHDRMLGNVNIPNINFSDVPDTKIANAASKPDRTAKDKTAAPKAMNSVDIAEAITDKKQPTCKEKGLKAANKNTKSNNDALCVPTKTKKRRSRITTAERDNVVALYKSGKSDKKISEEADLGLSTVGKILTTARASGDLPKRGR